MHITTKKLITAAAIVAAVAMVGGTAHADPKDRVAMHDFATGAAIDKTWATLDRTMDGVSTAVHTRDHAGHAYTLWYVIFNNPSACSDGVCNEDDIFIDPPPAPVQFNAEQIEAAQISVVSAGRGDVANATGRIQLHGGLDVGEVPTGANRVVIGRAEDGALVPFSPVTGLTDAFAAEIHLVLQDHGMAHTDADDLERQLTEFQGACNPMCVDPQFAVFLP